MPNLRDKTYQKFAFEAEHTEQNEHAKHFSRGKENQTTTTFFRRICSVFGTMIILSTCFPRAFLRFIAN